MPEIFDPSGLLAPLNYLISLKSYGLPLLLLFLYAPNPVHLPTQGLLLESSFQGSIVVASGFAVLVAINFNVSGPFRYGKQQYGPELSRIIKGLPDWALPSSTAILVLLPWSRIWLLVLIPIAWGYTREHHREAVQTVVDLVDVAQSKAESASAAAREYTSSAARFEDRAYEIAARSWRDVRAGQNLRVVDYYDKEAQAWASVDGIVRATKAAARLAESVDDEVRRADDLESGPRISSLYDLVSSANGLARDASIEAQRAQDRTSGFAAAASLAKKSRAAELSNANRTTGLMNKVSTSAGLAAAAAQRVKENVEEARQFGKRAKTLASRGDIISALKEAESAGNIAKKADDELQSVKRENNNCRSYLRELSSA